MRPHPNQDGYLTVTLFGASGHLTIGVHRVIAMTFIGPPPAPHYRVRHRDRVRHNNKVSNLLWGTAKDNADDRDRHGRTARGRKNGKTKLTAAIVRRARRLCAAGHGIKRIAETLQIGYYSARSVITGHTWAHLPLGSREAMLTRRARQASVSSSYRVYALIDPTSREYRYVGVTSQKPHVRLYRHIKAVRFDGVDETLLDPWLRRLTQSGLAPAITSLQMVSGRRPAYSAEAYWIAHMTRLGCALLNTNKLGTTRSPTNNGRLVKHAPISTYRLCAKISSKFASLAQIKQAPAPWYR